MIACLQKVFTVCCVLLSAVENLTVTLTVVEVPVHSHACVCFHMTTEKYATEASFRIVNYTDIIKCLRTLGL